MLLVCVLVDLFLGGLGVGEVVGVVVGFVVGGLEVGVVGVVVPEVVVVWAARFAECHSCCLERDVGRGSVVRKWWMKGCCGEDDDVVKIKMNAAGPARRT